VTTALVDHNIEGQAALLWGALAAGGWLDLVPLALVTFIDTGLPVDSSDRAVWRFAQAHGMILLTDNRNMDDEDALELTIREEATEASFPVLTIGRNGRMDEPDYRRRCAERLVEIVLDIERYLGGSRIFIP
jgi:hypothetical protein